MERILSDQTIESNPQWFPHAAIAGWLVPGLGHIILGQRKRGLILMVSILSLWAGGILIGGISVIDRYDRTEPQPHNPKLKVSWWFFGQAMIAPSIVIERVRGNMASSYATERAKTHGDIDFLGDPRMTLAPAESGDQIEPPYEPSLARVAEQGTLFTALAGLLNLLAIIDALYCDPKRRMRFEHGRGLEAVDDNGLSDSSEPGQAEVAR